MKTKTKTKTSLNIIGTSVKAAGKNTDKLVSDTKKAF